MKKFSEVHSYCSKSHPDLTKQWKRWYSEKGNRHEKKHIPTDVSLSPLSVLIWWLGDGTLRIAKTYAAATFCTEGFLKEEIETILLPKFNQLGFKAYRSKKNRIELNWQGTLKMLDYINEVAAKTGGKLKCYHYKFLTKEQRSRIDNSKHLRPINIERLQENCNRKGIQILSPWNVDKMEFRCSKGHTWNVSPSRIIHGSGRGCYRCKFVNSRTNSWQTRRKKYGPSGHRAK